MLEQYSIVGRSVLIEALSPAFLEQISISEALAYRDANRPGISLCGPKIAI
jgi:hypothetical protein